MEKNMSKALQLFSTVLDQIENNVNRMVDPVGKINYAYASVTSLIFDQYLEMPETLIEEYEFAVHELYGTTARCYSLLDDLGAASPDERDIEAYMTEPVNVYLVYYIYNMAFAIIDFFDDFQTMEVPVWYEL
jgi:hypothetical protein